MRLPLFVLIAVLLLVPGWSGPSRLPLLRDVPRLSAERVALYPDDPEQRMLGELEFLGGVALASPDPAFGSFSAMSVRGNRFTLLSDGGNVVRFNLDSDWRPREVRFSNLRDGPGTGWEKRERDSESMAVDSRSGEVLVGFERANQIWRYDPSLSHRVRQVRPAAMRRWSTNGGPESLVVLPDGGAIVLSERRRAAGQPRGVYEALRFAGDPTRFPDRVFAFGYRPPRGFAPTDAAYLPDGRLLVLNRNFKLMRGFTAALTLFDARAIAPGKAVEGRLLALFRPPAIHDNFEALAVTNEKDATHVWIASDDNQSMFQRSLLLKFRLRPVRK